MKRVLIILITVVVGVSFFSLEVEAREKEDIIFTIAGPLYPEFSESFGITMYVNALQGRLQTHPALKGKMHLKIMEKGTLFGSQDEALTGVATGAAEMTYSGPHFLEQLSPEWKLGETPGMFGSWQHFLRTMETPPWKALHERMAKEKGVTILKWLFDIGDWYFFTDKGPVSTMADIKNHKIRFAGGEGFAKALKALGTTPVSLPYTEVVTGLQTHMIDGLITDMAAGLYYYELPRYTKYAVLIPIAIQPLCFVVNTKWYESLAPEARQAINDIFERIDVTKFYNNFEAACIEKWKNDPKLTLVKLSEPEEKKWHSTMRSSVKVMLTDINPKYIEAIDSTR
jgi:TRAP-type C4-dicarboxylate transport system substrate-binding protein